MRARQCSRPVMDARPDLAAAITQSQFRIDANGGDIGSDLDHNSATDLLTRLDELSDEQVYELLDAMAVGDAVRK